jgi:hypothetical protein
LHSSLTHFSMSFKAFVIIHNTLPLALLINPFFHVLQSFCNYSQYPSTFSSFFFFFLSQSCSFYLLFFSYLLFTFMLLLVSFLSNFILFIHLLFSIILSYFLTTFLMIPLFSLGLFSFFLNALNPH